MSPRFESLGSSISSSDEGGTKFTGACDCGTWFKSVTVKKKEVTCVNCKVTKTI